MSLVIRKQELVTFTDDENIEEVANGLVAVIKDTLNATPNHLNLPKGIKEGLMEEIHRSKKACRHNYDGIHICIDSRMLGSLKHHYIVFITQQKSWTMKVNLGYQRHSLKAMVTDEVATQIKNIEQVNELEIPQTLKEDVIAKMKTSSPIEIVNPVKSMMIRVKWHDHFKCIVIEIE